MIDRSADQQVGLSVRKRKRISGQADQRTGAFPSPIKWAGSKRTLVPVLRGLLPSALGTYHEPFVGGGSLFWALAADGRLRLPRATLSDTNPDLMMMYRVLQTNAEELIAELAPLENTSEVFEVVKRWVPEELSDVRRAARFVYLLKTAFNGLWRVNKSGAYNVPFAENGNRVLDAERLLRCRDLLECASLFEESFEGVLGRAEAGDVVYFDPPYPPLSKTSSFTGYTKGAFGWSEHERLRDVARELKSRGVFVMISNSDQPRVRELYKDGFRIHETSAPRSVNSDGAKRGRVAELVIC